MPELKVLSLVSENGDEIHYREEVKADLLEEFIFCFINKTSGL